MLTDTFTIKFDQIFGHYGLANLTHKINHNTVFQIRLQSSILNINILPGKKNKEEPQFNS